MIKRTRPRRDSTLAGAALGGATRPLSFAAPASLVAAAAALIGGLAARTTIRKDVT